MTTKIEWVKNPDGTPGETWNPTVGCTMSCGYCYMRDLHNRRHEARKQGKKMPACYRQRFEEPLCLPERLEKPLRWRKPRGVFVDSAGDLFDPAIPFEFIAAVFGVMAATPRHTFQVLTKRPERMAEWFRWYATLEHSPYDHHAQMRIEAGRMPLPNVWLGTTCEDQQRYDERAGYLLDCPAALHFVSFEPLLGHIVIPPEHVCRYRSHASGLTYTNRGASGWPDADRISGLGWAIVGGETGPGARPMHPDWARSLRDQCQAAGVSFFYKQGPGDHGLALRKMPALDGRTWDEMPRRAP